MQNFDNDILGIIINKLTYKDSILLNIALCNKNIDYKKLFYDSILFTSTNKVEKHNLYGLLKYSTLNPILAYNLIYNITQNEKLTDLKLPYNIRKVNSQKIKNTIKIFQIMLMYVGKNIDNSIFSHYNNIYVNLNDKLINHLLDVIGKMHTIDEKCKNKITKFRFQLYENKWYNSNYNVYVLLVLYLLDLKLVSSSILKDIKKYVKKCKYVLVKKCKQIQFNAFPDIKKIYNDKELINLVDCVLSK